MNVICLAPECFPFAKATDLGDIVSSLSKDIERLGNNVKVFIPRYGSINPQNFCIERIPLDFKVKFNDSIILASAFKGIIPNSLVSMFFIESQNYFSNSKEIYLSQSNLDEERFKFFCTGALEVILKLKIQADIIHLFTPHTIHTAKLLRSKNLEYAQLSKVGIVLQEEEPFFSIPIGIDESIYNPEHDNALIQTYSKDYFSVGKKKCKEDLLNILDMSDDLQSPVFVISSFDSKEAIFLDGFLSEITSLSPNSRFIILTNGQELKHLSNYKNVKACSNSDHLLTKKIYAGSDFFINLNEQNPCSTSCLIGMKYGSIPIIFSKCLNKDTIVDIESTEYGSGIVFKSFTKERLLEAVGKALTCFKNKEKWTKVVKQAMSFDSSKFASAEKYIDAYKKIPLHENVYQ